MNDSVGGISGSRADAPSPSARSRPIGFDPGRDEEAWRPALIAFYERDELRQKAANLKNGAPLDYLDRRAIEALVAAAELVPMRDAA